MSLPIALIVLGMAHLLYTYLVYGLVMRFRGATPLKEPNGPRPQSVSIVIAARKPGAALAEKVAQLLREPGTPRELIVALDGDDPLARSALAPLEPHGCSVVVLNSAAGKASALNAAVERAKGEVLVFMDARQRIAEGSIDRLAAWFRRPDIGAVGGTLVVDDDGAAGTLDRYWDAEVRLRVDEAAVHSSAGVSGALYALRRDLWKPLPAGLLLDDVWVPMQAIFAGYRVAYEPDATAHDVPFRAPEIEFERKVRTLTGNFQLLAWWPALLNPGQNPIWLQFMSHKVSRLFTVFSLSMIAAGLFLLLGSWWPMAAAAVVLVCLGAYFLPEPWQPVGSDAIRVCLMLFAALTVAVYYALVGRWNVWAVERGPPVPRTSLPL